MMENIRIEDVAVVRQQTGCGMMDCKKALLKNDNDINAAVEYLKNQPKSLASLITYRTL